MCGGGDDWSLAFGAVSAVIYVLFVLSFNRDLMQVVNLHPLRVYPNNCSILSDVGSLFILNLLQTNRSCDVGRICCVNSLFCDRY